MVDKKQKAKPVKNPQHTELEPIDYSALSAFHRGLRTLPKKQLPALYAALVQHAQKAAGKKGVPAKKGVVDINMILQLVQMFPMLLGAFQQILAMFHTNPAPVPVPPPVVTPPVVVTPPPPPPVVTPPPADRVIAALTSHFIGAEGWAPSKGHFPVAFDPTKDIAGAGYRLHGDTTPKDQNGQPFYNSDLERYPNLFCTVTPTQDGTGKFTCGEGKNRTYFEIRLDGKVYGPQGDAAPGQTPFDQQGLIALTSETDDGSFTPVWVVSQEAPLDEEHTFAWRQTDVAADGTKVVGNWTTDVRVHAWGFA